MTLPRRVTVLALGLAAVLGVLGMGHAAIDFNRVVRSATQQYGAAGNQAMRDWQTLVVRAKGLSDLQKLQRTNLFFNTRIRFSSDMQIWGKNDFWATPIQTMGRGQGDCEDYSIAKYVTLLEMGVPRNKLRMIYVKANYQGRSQAHMVLGYFATPSAEPLILDNINGEILPASRRRDLFPVFSFNSEGLWAGGKTVRDPSSRLSRWRSVLDRMAADGFTQFARR